MEQRKFTDDTPGSPIHTMKAMVQFKVGPSHQLYNKFVLAEVEAGCGYDGRQVAGTTINPVHYPEDPKGLLALNGAGEIIEYDTRPAYDAIFEGWVSKIQLADGHIIDSEDYAEYHEYLRLKAKFEKH